LARAVFRRAHRDQPLDERLGERIVSLEMGTPASYSSMVATATAPLSSA
jgi:hypothetical protein